MPTAGMSNSINYFSVNKMRSIPTLCSFVASVLALPNFSPDVNTPAGQLLILDTGVGYRKPAVERWRTHLRSISTEGESAAILQTYDWDPPQPEGELIVPINANNMAKSDSSQSLFITTDKGILRTAIDGSNPRVVVPNLPNLNFITVAVAEQAQRIYFSTIWDGLIRRANFDGSGIEIFRNVSRGLKYDLAIEQAHSVLVDEETGWLYWSVKTLENGSIKRVRLDEKMSDNATEDAKREETLWKGLAQPSQLRIKGEMIYWAEPSQWANSTTALARAKLPSGSGAASLLTREVVVHSWQNVGFYKTDMEHQTWTMSIESFVFKPEGDEIWFVTRGAGRGTLYAQLWEVDLDGRNSKVLNDNISDLGSPTGIEFVG